MNNKTLSILTLALVIFSCFSFTDDDDGALVYGLAGFVYSTILYLSIRNRPSLYIFIPSCLLLGIGNLFVYWTSVIVIWLPESIGMFLFYLFPSLVGALLTLFVLIKLWGYKIDKKHSLLLLGIIAFSALISSSTLFMFKYTEIRATGLFWSINCIFWWIAFSVGLIVNDKYIGFQRMKTVA